MIVVRLRRLVARVIFFLLVGATCWSNSASALATLKGRPSLPRIEANDNLRPAGTLDGGTLTVALRAGAVDPRGRRHGDRRVDSQRS